MATLTVSHYLYLTKEQRYSLNEGEDINIVGICVPVWFSKGNTSEPAQEIFCKYKIQNTRQGVNIKQNDNGFTIIMPNLEADDSVNEELMKTAQNKIGTSESLLDLADGGKEFSEFKLYQKLQVNDELHHLIHYIDISPIEVLTKTIN